MKFITAIGLSALLTIASASPVDVLQARAITHADFSNFAVTCNGSTCSYSTNIVLSDSTSFSCTHSTTGATIPTNSGFWTCTAAGLLLRMNKVPAPSASYRIVLTDSRVVGSPVTVDRFSPVAEWPGDAGYTGPSSFRAD